MRYSVMLSHAIIAVVVLHCAAGAKNNRKNRGNAASSMGQQFDPEMMRRMGSNGGRNPMGREGMEGMMPGSGGGMPGGGMPGGGMPGGGMHGEGMPGGGMPGGGMPGGGMPGAGMPGGGMPGGGMPGGGMPGGGMPGGGMPGGMGTPGMKPGEGPAEQEARYRRYEKRRKRQEAEHRDMDLEIEDVINKILTEDVPRNYRPSNYDFKRKPSHSDRDESEEEDEDENDPDPTFGHGSIPRGDFSKPGGTTGGQHAGGVPKGVSFSEQIRQIYKTHNPAKLKDVPIILKKYKGREKLLMKKLMKKYMSFVTQSGARAKSTEKSRRQARRSRQNRMQGMPPPSESKELLNMEDIYHELLIELYSYINRSKLENRTFIPLLLKKYEKKEDMLIEAVLQKHWTQSLYLWKFGAVLGTEENTGTAFSFQLKSYYAKVNPEKVAKCDEIVAKFDNIRMQRKVVGAIIEKYMPALYEWMSRGVTVAVSDKPPKSQYDIPDWMMKKMSPQEEMKKMGN